MIASLHRNFISGDATLRQSGPISHSTSVLPALEADRNSVFDCEETLGIFDSPNPRQIAP
ncbi:hypothetical protein RRSWK_01665 [Rhodopirellula sp. SWK7]|nr:hypothetical protein RRSWK_01665 [Rhodopirellula sp. SWK7]